MKNSRNIFIFAIFGLILFASCQKNDPILFQNEDSFAAFEVRAGSVAEATVVDGVPVPNEIEIKVMLVTLDNTAVTVNFEFSTEGIDNPAVEGADFQLLNAGKSLTFNGMGHQSIRIRTIDDDIFTGDRQVHIVLTSVSGGYKLGAERRFLLTVVDDEHPLNLVLGAYNVTGTDAWGGAVNVTIETSAVSGALDKVSFPLNQLIPGWGAPDNALVYADVDLDEMTFYIQAGQEFPSFGYGPCRIGGWDGVTDDPLEDGEFVKATIDANGNITMLDWIGVQITEGDNAGLWFDIWANDVVWTKQGKNFMPDQDYVRTNFVLRSR